jgi:RHS repeat-associated protein
MTSAVVSGGRNLAFQYDDRNQLRIADADSNATYKSVFRYNPAGELIWRKDYTAGTSIGAMTATYDKRGNLLILSDTMTNITRTYGWNPNNTLFGIGHNLVTVRSFDYDAFGRLNNDLVWNTSGQLINARSHGYDPAGNLISKIDWFGTGSNTYTYNPAGQLTDWTDNAGVITSYTYDKNSNRTGWTRPGSPATTQTYDGRNRLTQIVENSVATNYTWDARGTLDKTTTSGIDTQYSFDPLGRQTLAAGVSYVYDALDRVATRNSTAFSYSGMAIDPFHDGTIRYLRSPAGRPIGAKKGTTTVIPELDRHGDLVALHNPTDNAITDTRSYQPFGELITTTGTFNPSIGYQSDYTDPTTNKVWMGARWYTPGTATFTSRDTYAGDTNNPINLNRYTYAQNNPTTYWDPDGHGLPAEDIKAAQQACADKNGTFSLSNGIPHCELPTENTGSGSNDGGSSSNGTGSSPTDTSPQRVVPVQCPDGSVNFGPSACVGVLPQFPWLVVDADGNGIPDQLAENQGDALRSYGVWESMWADELDRRARAARSRTPVCRQPRCYSTQGRVDYGDSSPVVLTYDFSPRPGLGYVTLALFVPTETSGFPGVNAMRSHGDGRRFNAFSDPSNSRAYVTIDYETGSATLQVNPSCGTGGPPGDCHDPLPVIDDFSTAGRWFQRLPLVDDSNRISFRESGADLSVRFAISNSDKRAVAPALNASFRFTANDDGTVELRWDRDAYPALEAYHWNNSGDISILVQQDAAHNSDRGLLPLPWTDKHGSGYG